MSTEKLSTDAIQQSLDDLNKLTNEPWVIANGKLHKEFIFSSFVTAFGFMTTAALICEKMNHHPEWCNVYKTVRVELITHECAGISELDFKLATQMEKVAAQLINA